MLNIQEFYLFNKYGVSTVSLLDAFVYCLCIANMIATVVQEWVMMNGYLYSTLSQILLLVVVGKVRPLQHSVAVSVTLSSRLVRVTSIHNACACICAAVRNHRAADRRANTRRAAAALRLPALHVDGRVLPVAACQAPRLCSGVCSKRRPQDHRGGVLICVLWSGHHARHHHRRGACLWVHRVASAAQGRGGSRRCHSDCDAERREPHGAGVSSWHRAAGRRGERDATRRRAW